MFLRVPFRLFLGLLDVALFALVDVAGVLDLLAAALGLDEKRIVCAVGSERMGPCLRGDDDADASSVMLAPVYWILAAVFIVIALTRPRLRPLGVVGCIILGAMLTWGMVQRLRSDDPSQASGAHQRGKPTSPAAALHSVPLTMVAAQDVRMSGGGAPFELRGRIANSTNDVMLRSVTIRVTRRDCYEGAVDPSGCVRLWQDEHWIAVAVPAGQSRDFVEAIWMHGNAPRPRGTVQDTFELIAATGEGGVEAEKAEN